MSFKKKSLEIIRKDKATRFLVFSVAIVMFLDVFITVYELTFIRGIKERNPIAIYLIQELGIYPGLLISFIFETAIIAAFFVLLRLLPLEMYQKRKETPVLVILANMLWMVFLIFAFISHFRAIIINLLNLMISIP